MDISASCRVCLNQRELNPIFNDDDDEEKYQLVFNLIAGEQISKNDEIPALICTTCVKFINECISFRKICANSTKILKENLSNGYKYKIKDTCNCNCHTNVFIDVNRYFDLKDETFLNSENIEENVTKIDIEFIGVDNNSDSNKEDSDGDTDEILTLFKNHMEENKIDIIESEVEGESENSDSTKEGSDDDDSDEIVKLLRKCTNGNVGQNVEKNSNSNSDSTKDGSDDDEIVKLLRKCADGNVGQNVGPEVEKNRISDTTKEGSDDDEIVKLLRMGTDGNGSKSVEPEVENNGYSNMEQIQQDDLVLWEMLDGPTEVSSEVTIINELDEDENNSMNEDISEKSDEDVDKETVPANNEGGAGAPMEVADDSSLEEWLNILKSQGYNSKMPEGGYKCEKCNKTFKSYKYKDNCPSHKPTIICEHCGITISKAYYLYHCKAVHGYKREKCKHCDYEANSNEAMKIHERKHTGEKPYKCKQCDAAFHRHSTYLRHSSTHMTEKTIKCDQCPKMFKSKSCLHAHKHCVHKRKYSVAPL